MAFFFDHEMVSERCVLVFFVSLRRASPDFDLYMAVFVFVIRLAAFRRNQSNHSYGQHQYKTE